MDEMSACAAVARACSLRPTIFGITSAARMPMMVTTSSISTSVNARRSCFFRRGVALIFVFIKCSGSFDVVLEREDRQQHRDENDTDESRDEKQHQRFREGHG